MRALLIQVRPPGSPTVDHEQECVRALTSDALVEWTTINALEHELGPEVLDGKHALVIGGSGAFSVHHPASEDFVVRVRRVVERALVDQVPGFGICFGHQLLGMHLGAEVVTDETLGERGTIELELTEDGAADELFGHLQLRFRGHTGHTDHVTSTPSGVRLLARSDDVETQAFRVEGAPFYSAQFHPDLTASNARERYRGFVEKKASQRSESLPDELPHFDDGATDTEGLLLQFLRLADAAFRR